MRGLFVGDDLECFRLASELSVQVNIQLLDRPIRKAVVYLDPEEFHSTWLGNKAIYRTRMALADGAELIVLAPGVKQFGEDPTIDRMIRRFGYHGTPATLDKVNKNPDLAAELSTAAHLIHSSSEGRVQHYLLSRRPQPGRDRRRRIPLCRSGQHHRAIQPGQTARWLQHRRW